VLAFQFVIFQKVMAQSIIGHSPISRFGIGQSFGSGLTRNEGMAGCGLAVPNSDHPNLINPALLSFNRKVDLDIDLRYVYRNLRGPGNASLNDGGGGPAQLSFIIPITKRLSSAFGIRPKTFRDFIFDQKRFEGPDSLSFRNRGLGGITQVWFASGYELNQTISLGLEASYLFGTLEDSVSFGVLPASTNFNFISIYKRKVSQFVFKPGIHLRIPLTANKSTYLAFGGTADLGNSIGFREYRTFTIKGAGGQQDTLQDGNRSSVKRSVTYSAGVSLFNTEVGSINAEFDWIEAAGENDENTIVKTHNAIALRLGGEYTIGTKKSTRYWNIITFRGGVSYQQFPLQQDGIFITDQKVSIGASFPIIRKEAKFSRPLINLAVAYGQRGLKDSNVGLEKYLQVTVGFTLNDFLWFNRYRID
jgi:hypothetical protein